MSDIFRVSDILPTYFTSPYVFYYFPKINVMFYAIWYHLHSLKNVKNTYEGVLLSVKLQDKSLKLYY